MIVLNAPADLLVSYSRSRARRAVSRALSHLYWLATASSDLRIERIDDHSLRVQPERGFLWSAPERHYRGDARALRPGTQVPLSQMTAQMTAQTPDGRPAATEFQLRANPSTHRATLSCASKRPARAHRSRPPNWVQPLHLPARGLLAVHARAAARIIER